MLENATNIQMMLMHAIVRIHHAESSCFTEIGTGGIGESDIYCEYLNTFLSPLFVDQRLQGYRLTMALALRPLVSSP